MNNLTFLICIWRLSIKSPASAKDICMFTPRLLNFLPSILSSTGFFVITVDLFWVDFLNIIFCIASSLRISGNDDNGLFPKLWVILGSSNSLFKLTRKKIWSFSHLLMNWTMYLVRFYFLSYHKFNSCQIVINSL